MNVLRPKEERTNEWMMMNDNWNIFVKEWM